MNNLKPIRLSDLKTQAVFLIKDLKNNPDLSSKSAKRFLQISCFSGNTEDWLIEHYDIVQLKHAYNVIALENRFNTWADLKKTVIENDCLYKSGCVGFIHAWFNDYQKAEIYFRQHGGYLLSFWKDFVVCGKEYISCIGLSQYDDHWKSIGYNWAKPNDKKAFQLLNEKAKNNYLSQK